MGSISMIALFCLISSLRVTKCGKSLCDDPYIHAADRMANNTYRVYRDNFYWDLIGLPDKVAKVNGPYRNWWPNMAPLTSNTAVFTLIGGSAAGLTFKYQNRKMWTWNQNGRQRAGGKSGSAWSGFPQGTSYGTAFVDGDLDKKGYPMLIAFAGIRAHYFRTSTETFQRIGDEKGYLSPGQFDEKFPGDLTAAMPFPSSDSDVKYYVYLFKRDKHCFRPITGENGCKKWRENKELFGCSSGSGGGNAKTEDSGSGADAPNPAGSEDNAEANNNAEANTGDADDEANANLGTAPTASKPSSGSIETQNFYLFLFTIFCLMF